MAIGITISRNAVTPADYRCRADLWSALLSAQGRGKIFWRRADLWLVYFFSGIVVVKTPLVVCSLAKFHA